MKGMDIKGMDVTVISNLYCAGMTEDGEAYSAEEFSVLIENVDGSRWIHEIAWKGCRVHYDSETGCSFFEDTRAYARAQAEALCARIVKAGAINPTHWDESYPAYGSIAYQIQNNIIDSCGNFI